MSLICRMAALGLLALSLTGCEVELAAGVHGSAGAPWVPRTCVVVRGALFPDGPGNEPWRPARVAEQGLAGLYQWDVWIDVRRDGR
ncbi:MAG TPA: hypothetical protein VLA43_12395 [Longimicrobiales bacterium]|nr:hypothetical protein [Longimicrobiales bacterium]